MKKLTAKSLLLIMLFFGAGITSAYSAQQSNEQSNVTLKAIPEIRINGEKFLLLTCPEQFCEKTRWL